MLFLVLSICDLFVILIFVCDFFVISREVYGKKSVICPSDIVTPKITHAK